MNEFHTPNRIPSRTFNEWIEGNNRIEARCDTSAIRRAIEEIEARNKAKRIEKQALVKK